MSDTPATPDAQLRRDCTELLEKVEEHLRSVDHPVLRRLRPGLSDEQMDELTAPHGLVLGPELRAWWSWHDGVDVARDEPLTQSTCLLRGKTALSLTAAIEDRNEMRNAVLDSPNDDYDPDDEWPPSWVKLIAPQNYLAAVNAPSGPTRFVDMLEALAPGGPTTVWPSLAAFLRSWIEALDKKVLVPDPQLGWTVDEDVPERELVNIWVST